MRPRLAADLKIDYIHVFQNANSFVQVNKNQHHGLGKPVRQ